MAPIFLQCKQNLKLLFVNLTIFRSCPGKSLFYKHSNLIHMMLKIQLSARHEKGCGHAATGRINFDGLHKF